MSHVAQWEFVSWVADCMPLMYLFKYTAFGTRLPNDVRDRNLTQAKESTARDDLLVLAQVCLFNDLTLLTRPDVKMHHKPNLWVQSVSAYLKDDLLKTEFARLTSSSSSALLSSPDMLLKSESHALRPFGLTTVDSSRASLTGTTASRPFDAYSYSHSRPASPISLSASSLATVYEPSSRYDPYAPTFSGPVANVGLKVDDKYAATTFRPLSPQFDPSGDDPYAS